MATPQKVGFGGHALYHAAGIIAYMIYLEGPEYPEYVMHFLT